MGGTSPPPTRAAHAEANPAMSAVRRIPLEANGQTSWLIDQAFPGTDTSDFAGSVRCDSVGVGRFSAVALEMDSGNRIFATLPVVLVPQMPDRE